ncbi:hypothetical protein SDC9_130125 [bioreactor metagenome]|uniref:Uncharacterized protein n=1 Tax=bioreactor metagenome TaxID=1076179 RepID=A0A645D2T2_9ZZZZ
MYIKGFDFSVAALVEPADDRGEHRAGHSLIWCKDAVVCAHEYLAFRDKGDIALRPVGKSVLKVLRVFFKQHRHTCRRNVFHDAVFFSGKADEDRVAVFAHIIRQTLVFHKCRFNGVRLANIREDIACKRTHAHAVHEDVRYAVARVWRNCKSLAAAPCHARFACGGDAAARTGRRRDDIAGACAGAAVRWGCKADGIGGEVFHVERQLCLVFAYDKPLIVIGVGCRCDGVDNHSPAVLIVMRTGDDIT